MPRGATLLAAIGAGSLPRTLELGRAAFDHGCQAVLLPMPWFFPYSQSDLAAYAAHVADALGGPTLLYDLPAFTTALEPETTLALLQSQPHIIGIKDSSGVAGHVHRFAAARGTRDWTLLAGDDRLGFNAAVAGWDGAISGLAGCCPELLVALNRAARLGWLDEARRFQGLIDELIEQLSPLPVPWGVRAVLAARGLDPGPAALPVSIERAAQIAAIEDWLPGWLDSAGIPDLRPVRAAAS
jgi:4-hydroxy-tetrahydrodipicolinate synthase